MDFERLKYFKQYLNTVNSVLEGYFEEQKEYICCKKGCSYCCEKGQYPFSEVEFDYIMLGFFKLSKDEQIKVLARVKKIKEEFEKAEDKKAFMYRCPFLNDEKECSIYDFRGIICRTFGLMTKGADGRIKVPFCCFEGYNYSNVIDLETKKISAKKVKERGFEEEPLGFNISYEFLTDPDFEKGFKFEFGEKKPLIEWFIKQ